MCLDSIHLLVVIVLNLVNKLLFIKKKCFHCISCLPCGDTQLKFTQHLTNPSDWSLAEKPSLEYIILLIEQ